MLAQSLPSIRRHSTVQLVAVHRAPETLAGLREERSFGEFPTLSIPLGEFVW